MFGDFFAVARGNDSRPYAYQEAFAEQDWPDVAIAPTGLGKTAAVVLGWAWKHATHQNPPRRLVYCLPMRALVEQTEQNITKWLRRLHAEGREDWAHLPDPDKDVHVLMGGHGESHWYERPEEAAILVGTQDMLLSRALMRGYAMSRFRWPVDFGLLHNDAQWIFDEVQLMGSGLLTSAQLEGFRYKFKTYMPAKSLWISATFREEWLQTIDFPKVPSVWSVPEHFPSDAMSGRVRKLVDAPKPISMLEVSPEGASVKDSTVYAGKIADVVMAAHQENRTTLVIVNTVARARSVYSALQQHTDVKPDRLVLIHSRFRSGDRKVHMEKLPQNGETKDMIIVATQAIEAGIDLSAAVLITELAPIPSLVQRFGRVNRYGELNGVGGGKIYWVDLVGEDVKENAKNASLTAPYTLEDLRASRTMITALGDARPSNLTLPETYNHSARWVLRSRDIVDLYDTDPDLAGFDVDVSPYIRDAKDTDVRVFWRKFDSLNSVEGTWAPRGEEFCAIGIDQARNWCKKIRNRYGNKPQVFCLDPQHRGKRNAAWVPFREDPWPGLMLMVHSCVGGYAPDIGFDPDIKKEVPSVDVPKECWEIAAIESSDADPDSAGSEQKIFVGLTDHLEHVTAEAVLLCDRLGIEASIRDAVIEAARWHDLGKAQEQFQVRLVTDDQIAYPRPEGLLAKARDYDRNAGRPYFRHELASALAYLSEKHWSRGADLVAFLIAAHHGKVRMNLRAFPAEEMPGDGRRFARGIWDGDFVPAVNLGGEIKWGGGEITLSPMELGEDPDTGASWTDRARNLLAEHGPFRLAWMEAIVRIADWRASANERAGAYDG